MTLALPAGRSLLIAGLVLLGLAACGRRGALEAPPDPVAIAAEREKAAQRQALRASRSPTGAQVSAIEGQTNAPGQAQVLDDGDADDPVAEDPAAASPAGALGPGRKRVRQPFVVPKEPFILDRLL